MHYEFDPAGFRVALAKWLAKHSYRQTAKASGLGATNVFEIASGKHAPTLADYLALCGMLEVDPGKFIIRKEEPNVCKTEQIGL